MLVKGGPDSKVHGAHLGPTRPSWAPCWPRELCNLGGFIHTIKHISTAGVVKRTTVRLIFRCPFRPQCYKISANPFCIYIAHYAVQLHHAYLIWLLIIHWWFYSILPVQINTYHTMLNMWETQLLHALFRNVRGMMILNKGTWLA